MAALTEKEKELVAIGAAIGAGCQPCTQYHVGAALKSGLSHEEVRWAIDEAQVVRREGGVAVANWGRRVLGVEQQQSQPHNQPSDRSQALTYIGAAAGCNAGSLLTPRLATAEHLGLTAEELRSALEITEVVKQHAAEFLRHDAERALKETAPTAPADNALSQGCCEPGCDS